MEAFTTQILDLIEPRFKIITTANGYSNDVGNAVKRATLTPFASQDHPSINFWTDGFVQVKDSFGKDKVTLNVKVEGRNITRDEPFVTTVSSLMKDIHTGLHRDPVNGPLFTDTRVLNLGDVVEDIRLTGATFYIGEGQAPVCAVYMEYEIDCYVRLGDLTVFSKSHVF